MLVRKITSGSVVQTFDTESGRFIAQEFVAGEECEYEDEDGDSVDPSLLLVNGTEATFPFGMEQPATPDLNDDGGGP